MFTVESLGAYYVEELSALANKHGAVRVPKSLFKGRTTYALGKLRELGHNVDGRKIRRAKFVVVPRAGDGGRVVLRPDLAGRWNGIVAKKMEALTAPAAPAPEAVVPSVPVAKQTFQKPPAAVRPAPSVETKARKIADAVARVNGDAPSGTTRINLTEPRRFPTGGNYCAICVGSGESVCGEASVSTYRHVKICRVHLKLLQNGARLYARPRKSGGQIMITMKG